MDIIWNQERILTFLKYFYTLLPARVSLFDANGEELLAYPSNNTDFCNIICATEKGAAACQNCDMAAFTYVRNKKSPHSYQCHAGLTEIIAPIIANSDRPVGYLMLGQLRTMGAPVPHLPNVWASINGDPTYLKELENAYHNSLSVDSSTIEACVNILQACAAFVWLDDYIRISKTPLSQQVQLLIAKNLDKPLSIPWIASQLQIGKTTLCQTVKKDFGISVNQLITNIRVEEASRLLHYEDLTIGEIAIQVGIPDYNYFSKVFKKATNMSPSSYRKQNT